MMKSCSIKRKREGDGEGEGEVEKMKSCSIKKRVEESSTPDWANLARDPLTSIAARLSVVDYFAFSAVCSSWASVASPDNGGMPAPLPLRNIPYLLRPGPGDSCALVDVFTNSSLRLNPLPDLRGKWCVGSRFGWLAVADAELANPTLLNPFTHQRVHLPPISTLDGVEPVYGGPDGTTILHYLYCPRLCPGGNPPEPVGVCDINKLVISSSPTTTANNNNNFVAVALFTIHKFLIYTRPGDNKWTALLDAISSRDIPEDILYRERDNKFLILTNRASILELDFGGGTTTPQLTEIAPGLWREPDKHYASFPGYYLVEEDSDSGGGDLLLVCRKIGMPRSMYETTRVQAYRLNAHTADWDPITSLGHKSLFLGSSYPQALSVHQIPHMKPNCIYFTDDAWHMLPQLQEFTRNVGVYCLGDHSFRVIHPPDPIMTWPPPIWIAPPL